MDIGDIRQEYIQSGLNRADLQADPLAQFELWFKQARLAGHKEVNAMSIATVKPDGMPQVRTVLLKNFDVRGFVFFTNYNSAKGHELNETPKAAILFPWLDLERQVRISGTVEKVSRAESTDYFHSRPRGSQLGAWVSAQSKAIKSREVLTHAMQQIEEKFKDQEIPLPESWGGYRIKPEAYEFWQGRANRLHDRFQYTLKTANWQIDRLAP